MGNEPENKPGGKYRRCDAPDVMSEIALHLKLCTKAWIGYGGGRVVIIKDDYSGSSSYYVYEEGEFIFYDGRGGEQRVRIEEITEIAGY